ncbi:MAG: threonine dehydrogenase related Zn-dependent dehydrogenase [uncultured archaeon A07HR60]|jgi:Threonine dehydrogenase and related Zn-dependent dehydrogenases|nr:MAG: threonine dehydrogenase related Zn-dependent dehydrogenase [uncultured archaeon A07HR60]
MGRSLVFTEPETVELHEEPDPDPDDDELIVRTEASAVSPGTELLVYQGNAPDEVVVDDELDAIGQDLSYPISYGYAAAGTVEQTGAAVDDDWLGESVFAFNPHESLFSADPESVLRVPDGISPEEAVLLPIVETAVNFLMDGTPRVGERAAVFGQGLVGLVTTALLTEFPLDQLVAVEPVEGRRRRARQLGADHVSSPGAVDELFDESGPGGADLTYELSGNPDALDDAIRLTGFDGRVFVGSWYGTKEAGLDLGGRFHRSRISIESSQVSTITPELRGRWDSQRRYQVAWDRLRSLPTETLITDEVPVEQAHKAYDRLSRNPGDCVGTVFRY